MKLRSVKPNNIQANSHVESPIFQFWQAPVPIQAHKTGVKTSGILSSWESLCYPSRDSQNNKPFNNSSHSTHQTAPGGPWCRFGWPDLTSSHPDIPNLVIPGPRCNGLRAQSTRPKPMSLPGRISGGPSLGESSSAVMLVMQSLHVVSKRVVGEIPSRFYGNGYFRFSGPCIKAVSSTGWPTLHGNPYSTGRQVPNPIAALGSSGNVRHYHFSLAQKTLRWTHQRFVLSSSDRVSTISVDNTVMGPVSECVGEM